MARSVDAGGEPSPQGGGRADRIARRIMVVALLLLAISLLGSFVKLPYAIEYPGSMTDTLGTQDDQRIVRVDGARTYPTEGSLYFTTVSILGGPERHVSVWEWVRGHLDPDAEVFPEEEVFGTETSDEEVRRVNTAAMQGSQRSAIAVGIRSTGREVPQRNIVAEIVEGYPADGRLALEDEIRSVNGARVERVSEITAAISDRRPGEKVTLGVRRDGAARTVELTTRDIGQGRAGVGIAIEPIYDLRYEVSIDAGDVGGPSAGMMFALAVNDVLTPGPLTGGERIAGTGTINDSGQVGPIGGIDQKMIGAEEGGADYFLAPGSNCEDVVGQIPEGLEVIRVDDIDGAIEAVEAIAEGDTAALPDCG